MFSAKAIEKYDKIYKLSDRPMDSKVLLLELFKKYFSEWGWKTHKPLVDSLIKILESKPSLDSDTRLDDAFKLISNYIDLDAKATQAIAKSKKPLSIQGDFFSLLVVFFRCYPELIYRINPDKQGVYALLILGVFGLNSKLSLPKLPDEMTNDFPIMNIEWLQWYIKKIIPMLSPLLLTEVMEGYLRECASSFWSRAKPVDDFLPLQRALMHSETAHPKLIEKMAVTLKEDTAHEYKEAISRSDFALIYPRLPDFSLEQQQGIMSSIIALDEKQLIVTYDIDRMRTVISKIDETILHQDINKIIDIYFTDFDRGSIFFMHSRAILLETIFNRWIQNGAKDFSIPKKLMELADYFLNHDNAILRISLFSIYPIIARSKEASTYFNYQSQIKLIDMFFYCMFYMRLEHIKQVIDAIAPDLYNSSLMYFLENIRSRDCNAAIIILQSLAPVLIERKFDVSAILCDISTHIDECLKEKNNLLTTVAFLLVNLKSLLQPSECISDLTIMQLIKRLQPKAQQKKLYESLDGVSELQEMVYHVLDTMPHFFKIIANHMQVQLLEYLQESYAYTECHILIGHMLIKLARQFPQHAEQIFTDMSHASENKSKYASNIGDLYELPSMALIVSEKAILALELKKIELMVEAIDKLDFFPKPLVSLIVNFLDINNDAFLRDDKLLARHAQASARERKENETKVIPSTSYLLKQGYFSKSKKPTLLKPAALKRSLTM